MTIRKQMKTAFLTILILGILYTNSSFAFLEENNDKPLKVDEAFVVAVELINTKTYEIIIKIEDKYYVYKNKFKLTSKQKISKIEYSNDFEILDDPYFGKTEIYKKYAIVTLYFEQEPENFSILYQGCWEGGVCYPPTKKIYNIQSATFQDEFADNNQINSESIADVQTTNQQLLNNKNSAKIESLGNSKLNIIGDYSINSEMSFVFILLLFALAGLLLAFTPCVFPMIPILTGFILGNDKLTKINALKLSLIYVISSAAVFGLIGALVGWLGQSFNIQQILQTPLALGSFAIILFLMALGMFGVINIQMPLKIQNYFNQKLSNQAINNKTGQAILLGALSAILVGPCITPPFISGLLYIAQTGEVIAGMLLLFIMAFFMGLPLVMIAVFGKAIMPKNGVWLENIKYLLGIGLILLAIYFLDRVLEPFYILLMTSVVLMISSIYFVYELKGKIQTAFSRVLFAISFIILLYGIILFIGSFMQGRSLTNPFESLNKNSAQVNASMQSLKQAVKVTNYPQLSTIVNQNKKLNIATVAYFTAKWCIYCADIKQEVFNNQQVQQAMTDVALLEVDITLLDKNALDIMEQFGVFGPPHVLFIDKQANRVTELDIVGDFDKQTFLNNLSKLP